MGINNFNIQRQMKKLFIISLLFIPFFASADNPFYSGHYKAPYNPKAIVWGTTFYVRLDGNDSHAGTSNTSGGAFLTNEHAFSVAVAGDLVSAQAGSFTIVGTTTLPAGVNWRGIDSATTRIKGTITGLLNPIVNATSAEGTNGNQAIFNLGFDGQMTNSMPIKIWGRSNVEMYNCSLRDFVDLGVSFAGRNDLTGGPPTIYATGNSFHDNRMLNCAGWQHSNGNYGLGCLNVGGQTGMLIYNNYIDQSQRSWATGDGWPIKGANEGWLKGLHIYNNTLIKIPFGGTYGGDGGWDFCIELFNEQGLEINNNTIQGAIDMNFQTKGAYAYSVWIHDNTISQPTLNVNYESGIVFEYYTDGAIVEKNKLYNVSSCVNFNTRYANVVSNNRINNNLCYNIGRDLPGANNSTFIGISSEGPPPLPQGRYAVDSLNVYNNTFIAAVGQGPHWGFDFGGLDSGYERKIHIVNNIIMNSGDAFMTQGGAVPITSLSYFNNDIYLNGFSNNPYWNGTPPLSLPNGNNIHVDPLFVGGITYNLQVTSPCIDAGRDVGLPFFNTAPDIGYAEYGNNIYPTANAGSDTVIVYPTSSLTITGSGTDADGTIVSKAWTVVSGSATITNGTTYSPTFSNISGTIIVRLTVTDNDGATGNDDRTIVYVPLGNNSKTVEYILGKRY